MSERRLPAAFWALWAGFLANRLGLLAPAFLTLYLTSQRVTTGGETALAVGGYGAGAIGGGLLGGLLADRTGPRRTLLTSQAAAATTGFALMAARSPHLVIGLILVLGALNGFGRSAGYGLATHLARTDQWAQAYGRLYWATSIGTSVTAVLSGVLLQVWPPALFLPGALGAAGYAAVALALPEAETRPAAGPSGVVTDVLRPFLAPCVGPFLLLTLVLSGVYAQRHAAMPLDMYANGLSYGQLGLLFSFGAVLVVIVQPINARLTGRLPPGRALALSALLIGGGFWLNLVAHTPAQYAFVIAVWTYGEILTAPLALTFMAAHAPARQGSTYQGAYGFVWTLGFAVGAPAGHLVFTTAGRATLWWGVLGLGAAVAWGQIALARRCDWLDDRRKRTAPRGVPMPLPRSESTLHSSTDRPARIDWRRCSMTIGTNARHVREVDRVPGDDKIQVDPIDLGPVLGTWRNANRRTWGICAVELDQRDGQVWAHAWAADPQADEIRDWGEVPLDGLYTDGPASNRVSGYRATFDLGHARTQIQVNILHSVTVCAAFTTFNDGSGRANYMSREFFHRRG